MAASKWAFVPCLVIGVAFWFTLTGWFDNIWILTAFAVVAWIVLSYWRKASYRLVPSFETVDWETLDRPLQSRLVCIMYATLATALLLAVGALALMIFVPTMKSKSGVALLFTIIVWSTMVKFGVMQVLSHLVLSHRRD